MQRSPAAAARKCMHTDSAVPSHSKTEDSEENDEADSKASKVVATSQVVIAECRSASRWYSSGKERAGQST